MLVDAKSYVGSQTKMGTDPLARLTRLSSEAHTALFQFRVQDSLDMRSSTRTAPDMSWLSVRNQLVYFFNLEKLGIFTMAGVPLDVVQEWKDDVIENRGRGHISLVALNGLVAKCEKVVAEESISDALDVKRIMANWLREHVPWAKVVRARGSSVSLGGPTHG